MGIIRTALRKAANARVRVRRWAHGREARTQRPDAVFLGDSITEQWLQYDPGFFRGQKRRNAGIGGQTSRDMLARFDADVIAWRPRVVHIMAGTNDLWHGDPGPEATTAIANIAEMARRAQAAGIAVILAMPPPIGPEARPLFGRPELFAVLHEGLARLCGPGGIVPVDYATSLGDGRGGIRPGLTTDGVHLTAAGYRAIRGQAERALAVALGE
ncbi:GDSL-type esterase/lipase family protein [Sphingomonas sp. BIUV-7]|uniref:GDSL-type esterase/lipase family protein n=1 Tax=Sphingomonas natans TaxID=3063330 RepID=A0ABT8YBI0_9SPHN|nr:GDSL-type esterase/lipase family protein [Sphingomonas sp. BIUV-7]MDO6415064.1 GDSL-type esterase/lipase family protein [Sphingomonas sp. BIUV-7]